MNELTSSLVVFGPVVLAWLFGYGSGRSAGRKATLALFESRIHELEQHRG